MIVNFEGQQHQFPDDASEDEIRKALSGVPAVKPEPSVAADVAKQAGAGLVKGVENIPAALPSALGLVGQGVEYLFGKGDPEAVAQREQMQRLIAEQRKGGISQYLPEPETTAGKYARAAAEAVPAMVGTTTGGPLRAAAAGATAGATSEAAGQATEGTAAEPYARVAGALAPTAAGAAIKRALVRPVAPGRQALLDTLEQEGVGYTAGQRSGSKAMQYSESTLGDYPLAGGKATAAQERGQQEFTRAALRRIGLQGDDITPAAVNRAVGDIEKTFQNVSGRTSVRLDQQTAQDIGTVLNRYARKAPSQQREVINNWVDDIVAQGNNMPGDVYQVYRSDLSRQAHAARFSDPTYSAALRGLRNALDDSMRRSVSPADRAAWEQARRQWQNFRIVEGALKNTDAAGNVRISPAQLRQSAATRDRGGFARGLGDFNALARAGQGVLTPLPQSGTTPRAIAAGLFALPAAGAAGLLPGVGMLAAPPIAGRMLMSRPVQNYLRTPGTFDQYGRRAFGGLLGMQ